MKQHIQEKYDIMDVCLLAGKIMLEAGAETYRVEDTMMRIASSYGIEQSHSYVTPTGILFSIETDEPTKTKLIRIAARTTDLQKIADVNHISRCISAGQLNRGEAYDSLVRVKEKLHTFSLKQQLLAASVASACFLFMLQGRLPDVLPAFVIGGIGFWTFDFIHRMAPIKFFSEFTASFVIGVCACLAVFVGAGDELDKIIIGSVMPLVPGLLITNAVRDLMAGHLLSGLAKGAEAFLTASAIGSGIAIVLSIF